MHRAPEEAVNWLATIDVARVAVLRQDLDRDRCRRGRRRRWDRGGCGGGWDWGRRGFTYVRRPVRIRDVVSRRNRREAVGAVAVSAHLDLDFDKQRIRARGEAGDVVELIADARGRALDLRVLRGGIRPDAEVILGIGWFSQPAGVALESPNQVLSWQAPHAPREGWVFQRSSTWQTVQFLMPAGNTTPR